MSADLGEVLNTVINEHAAIGHSSELAWALWGCLALGIPLTQAAGDALTGCDDPVAALLALHPNAFGLVAAPLIKAQRKKKMNTDRLWDEHWTLAYEANTQGWRLWSAAQDHVITDPDSGTSSAWGFGFTTRLC